MKLIEYFDRTCIINLPERIDRLTVLRKELKRFGSDGQQSKVQVPFAPRPDEPNGYASRGVFGSFLSHLEILKSAMRDGLSTVWVLEDDATFNDLMVHEQDQIIDHLQKTVWDMCFFGHSLERELAGIPEGLVPHTAPFRWAHCYAVHSRVFPRLIAYLEETMANPVGHPRGGRMYIDGAYNLFRRVEPDVVVLTANPAMSIQRSTPSSLAIGPWYDRTILSAPVSLIRRARDEIWRRTGLFISPSPNHRIAIRVTRNRPVA